MSLSPLLRCSLPPALDAACEALKAALETVPADVLPDAVAVVAGLVACALLARPDREEPARFVPRPSAGRPLSPRQVGERLGRSADWVREHLEEIGWVQVGRRRAVTERQLEKYLRVRENPL